MNSADKLQKLKITVSSITFEHLKSTSLIHLSVDNETASSNLTSHNFFPPTFFKSSKTEDPTSTKKINPRRYGLTAYPLSFFCVNLSKLRVNKGKKMVSFKGQTQVA
jgi:hypothetical protein